MVTVAFCEVDEKCRRVLSKHWPRVPIYEDVRELSADTLRRDGIAVDVISGGFPCQPFSTAARGRNNKPDLWPEMLRLVRELRPRWVIAENVPGLRLEGVERVCCDLEGAGYAVWPFDLDTAPPGRHRGRQRFIFVAHANSEGEPRREEYAKVAGISNLSGCSLENDEPPLGVDDVLPGRMDRLRQIGNSISPWAAEGIGRAVMACQRK